MDFLNSDSRTAAETPTRMAILQQRDGDPIMDGKKPCVVLVSGASSRSMQAKLREEESARMKTTKGKSRKSKSDTVDFQKQLSEAASRFVVGFEGVERPDPDTGKLRDLTNSPADLAWFFDLNTISLAHLMRGDGGGIIQNEDESEDEFDWRYGSEMAKWLKPSFSQQVIDCAREDDNFLGKAGKG